MARWLSLGAESTECAVRMSAGARGRGAEEAADHRTVRTAEAAVIVLQSGHIRAAFVELARRTP
jgi:hypothetical protein